MPEGGRYELRSRALLEGGHYDSQEDGGRYGLRSGSPRVVMSAGSTNPAIWSIYESGAIRELTALPNKDTVFGSGLCYVPDNVIAGGGVAVTGGEKRSACSLFGMSSSAWSELPELSAARWGHGAVCVRGRVLVIGGSLPCEWTGTVEWLDMAQPDAGWQAGPTAPESLYCPKVVVLGSAIYVLDDYTGKFFCLDIEAGEWSCKSGLDTAGPDGVGQKRPGLDGPVRGSSMAVMDGKIYVAGSTCRVYDVNKDTWHHANSPSRSHYYGNLVRWGQGKLLLAGGDTGAVDVYDVTGGTWQEASFKLPAKTSFGSSLAIHA